MPCTGPSQEHAYKVGDEATDEILALLKEKYKVSKIPELNGFSLESEWEALEQKLRETVRELVWCNHSMF